MIVNEPFFTRSHFIHEESLEDMKYHSGVVGEIDALVTSKAEGSRLDYGTRKCKIKHINHEDYPEVCQDLISLLQVHRPKLIADKYFVREFQYLVYGPGGHFTVHQDNIPDKNPRRYTTITLLKRSKDLQGGNLALYHYKPEINNDNNIIDLNIHETVIFDADLYHGVDPIIQGTREVLVAWIHEKK
jgi:predicted 2-oxoglutarate/Fe(II)-dependent dioxygenase YbiX